SIRPRPAKARKAVRDVHVDPLVSGRPDARILAGRDCRSGARVERGLARLATTGRQSGATASRPVCGTALLPGVSPRALALHRAGPDTALLPYLPGRGGHDGLQIPEI